MFKLHGFSLNYMLFVQVWSFRFFKDDSRLITGSSDSELRVWSINFLDEKVCVLCQVTKFYLRIFLQCSMISY